MPIISKMSTISEDFSKSDLILTGNVLGNVLGNVRGNVIGDLSGNVRGNVFGSIKNNNATLTIVDNKLVLFDDVKQQILWQSSNSVPVTTSTAVAK